MLVAPPVATCPGAPQTVGCNHLAVPTRPATLRVVVASDGAARGLGTTSANDVALRSSRGDLLLGGYVGPTRLRLRGRWRTLDRAAIPAFAWRRDGGAFAYGRIVQPRSELPARLVIATLAGRRLRLRPLGVAVCGISPQAWSPRGRFVAVEIAARGGCGAGWRAAIVDVPAGRVVARGPVGPDATALLGGRFPGAAFTRDGHVVVASSGAGLTILPRPGTRGRVRLLRHCYADDPGALAPDGRVAVACGPDEARLRLGVVEATTGRRTTLGVATVTGAGTAWSPDGHWLAVPAGGGIGLLRDGVLRRIVPAPEVELRLTGIDDAGAVRLTATYIPPD